MYDYFEALQHIKGSQDFQLTSPSSLLAPGINRLHTVTSILKNFEFETQLFVNPKFETKEKETPFFSGTFEGEV